MRTVLLLGAGFPKIWGGKITSEATEFMDEIIKQSWTEPYKKAHERLSAKMSAADQKNFEKYVDQLEMIIKTTYRKEGLRLYFNF